MAKLEVKYDPTLEQSEIIARLDNSSPEEAGKDYQDNKTDLQQTSIYGVQCPIIAVNNIMIAYEDILSFELDDTGHIPPSGAPATDQTGCGPLSRPRQKTAWPGRAPAGDESRSSAADRRERAGCTTAHNWPSAPAARSPRFPAAAGPPESSSWLSLPARNLSDPLPSPAGFHRSVFPCVSPCILTYCCLLLSVSSSIPHPSLKNQNSSCILFPGAL